MMKFLSPVVSAIFAGNGEPIDFRSIVQQRGILLVNLRTTPYFSTDQANIMAG